MGSETFDLTVLPLGFCATCIERARAGREYQALELADGGRLVHAYCAEREVGAMLVLRPGRPQRWRLTTPVEALEWDRVVATYAAADAGLRRAESFAVRSDKTS